MHLQISCDLRNRLDFSLFNSGNSQLVRRLWVFFMDHKKELIEILSRYFARGYEGVNGSLRFFLKKR